MPPECVYDNFDDYLRDPAVVPELRPDARCNEPGRPKIIKGMQDTKVLTHELIEEPYELKRPRISESDGANMTVACLPAGYAGATFAPITDHFAPITDHLGEQTANHTLNRLLAWQIAPNSTSKIEIAKMPMLSYGDRRTIKKDDKIDSVIMGTHRQIVDE